MISTYTPSLGETCVSTTRASRVRNGRPYVQQHQRKPKRQTQVRVDAARTTRDSGAYCGFRLLEPLLTEAQPKNLNHARLCLLSPLSPTSGISQRKRNRHRPMRPKPFIATRTIIPRVNLFRVWRLLVCGRVRPGDTADADVRDQYCSRGAFF